ncbi:MAG: magnesium transporter [Myxococcales bacterium]|nr:magnesium transporter [Myxococcales bacterium]MCB9706194.1 magnesium transporter [Myxococcales bacterium]
MSRTAPSPLEPPTIAPESAGHLMVREVATAAADERVDEVRRRLAGSERTVVDPLCVVDDEGRLIGALCLCELVRADGEASLAALVDRSWPRASPEMDQERLAALARDRRVAGVPVVDGEGRLLGSVSALTLLDVVWREHVEDMQRSVGIVHAAEGARHALEDPPTDRFFRRIPWLLVGLAGSVLATGVVARFEAALEAQVTIAFFVPAIVYLADAIGTQTEAVAVRGLSLSHRPLRSILAGEVITGALIGVTLGALGGLLIWLIFGDPRLALGVGISLVTAGTVASAIGLLLPWLLSRAGGDPAFGSGPVATVVQDVLSLVIYFLVMSALLLD